MKQIGFKNSCTHSLLCAALLRTAVVLLTAAIMISGVGPGMIAKADEQEDGTKTQQDIIRIKKGEADRNIIPDRYNCGAKGELKKTGPGDTVGGIVLYGDSVGNTIIDFLYKNKDIKGKIVIKNRDFSERPVNIYHEKNLGRNIKLVFKNCKFSKFRKELIKGAVKAEFYNCSFESCAGSRLYFDRCSFGGTAGDGLVPYKHVSVNNCYFSDFNHYSDKGVHTDGTQIYGNAATLSKNISFNNCRFEVPAISIQKSAASINACIMLQMEYNGIDGFTAENCILNGGGYAIYSWVKRHENKKFDNVLFKNISVGCNSVYGTVYPEYNKKTEFKNLHDTKSLYVGTVVKENGQTGISVTNDTAVPRKLLVITDKAEYRFDVPANVAGSAISEVKSFDDLPIDILEVLPEDSGFVICFDVTNQGAPVQIRFENFTGKKVYVDRMAYPELCAETTVIAKGKCGDNVKYVLRSDGVLTISGKGETYNYHSQKPSPFWELSPYITKVKIEKGVKSVGAQMFQGMTGIEEFIIPNGLKTIGGRALSGCTSINVLNIPKSVKTIGESALPIIVKIQREK